MLEYHVFVTQPPGARLLPPLVSTQEANMVTIVGDGARCTIRFYGNTFGVPVGSWAGCGPGDAIDSPMSLDDMGATVVVFTRNGTLVGIDARMATAGAQLWSLSLGVPAAAWSPPLVVGNVVWVRTADNTTYAVNMASPPAVLLRVPNVTCHGARDVITSPVTLYSMDTGIVVAVSSLGCGVALNVSGVLLVAPLASTPVNFTRALTPVADISSGRMYFSTRDRTVCCVISLSGIILPCWSANPCITLTDGEGDLAPGIALTPDSRAYHDGMAYALDAAGTMHAISAVTGVAFYSNLIAGTVATSPVIVPNALGNNINVIVTVTTSGLVTVLYVGDAQVNPDDSSDDDGAGTAGISWTYQLSLLTSAGERVYGSDIVLVDGIAIRDDGRILVPMTDGSLCVIGPQHAAINPASQTTVIIVVTIVTCVCGIAIMTTVWCACMKRRRARLAAEAYRESLADAAAHYGDGDGDGDDAEHTDTYTALGSVEVDNTIQSGGRGPVDLIRRYTSATSINA